MPSTLWCFHPGSVGSSDPPKRVRDGVAQIAHGTTGTAQWRREGQVEKTRPTRHADVIVQSLLSTDVHRPARRKIDHADLRFGACTAVKHPGELFWRRRLTAGQWRPRDQQRGGGKGTLRRFSPEKELKRATGHAPLGCVAQRDPHSPSGLRRCTTARARPVHEDLQPAAPSLLHEINAEPVPRDEQSVVRRRAFGHCVRHIPALEVVSGEPSAAKRRALLTMLPNTVEKSSQPDMVGVEISISTVVSLGRGK